MIRPWKKINSKITYQDFWLTVRTDHCLTTHGHEMPDYHVIEYPTWINVLALTPDLEIVLVSEYAHGTETILTDIIGGIVDPSDNTPLFAAQRELKEETGYQGSTWFEVGKFYVNPKIQNNAFFTFLAIDVELTGERQLDSAEEIAVSLIPFNKFIEKCLSDTIHQHSLYYAALNATLHLIKTSSDQRLEKLKSLF